MQDEPKILEKNAQELLLGGKFQQAYESFEDAAQIYRNQGSHKESALCFASAASSWALKSGEEAFYNSARAYQDAAHEAEAAHDLEYASLLYRYAAISYERDMEFINYSECFYASKECFRKFLLLSLFIPGKVFRISANKEKRRRAGWKMIFELITLTFSSLLWGYGERPARAFFTAIFLVFLTALFYTQGQLARGEAVFNPTFFEAFYFSAVTFTTVGFGDITPVGFNKLIVIIEAFCGLFVIPVFIIGLSRKYLRV
ncbi:MAG: ion channel [Candidatus Omnitrophica bacterium]|nr:ion channel [Candidatus Omnitrophota bacterium]MDD5237854.1 ion channel [Candidatus Omnitrophota bacterium]